MAVPVPVATASTQTKDWRTFIDGITNNPIYSVKIPKADIDAVMANPATCDIRVFGALKIQGDITSFHLLVVGVDSMGNDIITTSGGASAIYDMSSPCPPICGNTNALNS